MPTVLKETDAVVIVVSEETGVISLAQKGRLTQELGREELAKILYGVAGTHPGGKE